MNVIGRPASTSDVAFLATMNQQLIRDEEHRSSMTLDELEKRMTEWLKGDYSATIFHLEDQTIGYALYKPESEWTYLRQFFILQQFRGQGCGRAAMDWLISNVFHDASRIRLDVLVGNAVGIAFWQSVGFRDYCITMEMECAKPRSSTES